MAENTSTSPTGDSRQPTDWRQRTLDWLFQQGTSTILLVGILIGGWRATPAVISQIQQGYVDYQMRDKENLAAIKSEHTKEIDKLATEVGRVTTSVDRQSQAVSSLAEELRKVHQGRN